MKKRQTKPEGICALTGEHGRFVKSHIIPQAFTRPTVKGAPLLQSTRGRGLARRWSSWYDPELVTDLGEDILSKIDSRGVFLLRKYQMVWSGWLVFRPNFTPLPLGMQCHGCRRVEVPEASEIIRFALSLAWRSFASNLKELEEITIGREQENMLKELTLGKEFSGASPFPVSITQISKVGERVNQTPILQRKYVPDFNGTGDLNLRILRIYMDGMIFHIHLDGIPEDHLIGNENFLGAASRVLITSVTHEESFQYENSLQLLVESYEWKNS